jgi:ubiquinone/menaquinone biosynthesis C-methylase UbiE
MPSEYETELEKYNYSNPIVKKVMKNFNSKLIKEIKLISPKNILDAGCGTGFLLKEISKEIDSEMFGIDILENSIEHAKTLCPDAKLSVGSVYEIPFDDVFDLTLCSEVVEHLDNPEKAILEIKRVSKNAIICVPYEPLFTLANLARLKYLKTFGNYPGHVQHWNKRSFKKLLSKHFSEVKVKSSSVWLIGVCKK